VPEPNGVSADFLMTLLRATNLPGEWVSLTEFGMDPFRDDLDSAVASLASLLRGDEFLCGHGLGCLMTLELGFDLADNIRGLILVSPASALRVPEVSDLDLAERFAARQRQIETALLTSEEKAQALFRERWMVDLHRFDRHFLAMNAALERSSPQPIPRLPPLDWPEDLEFLESPTLIVSGVNDPTSPVSYVRLLAAELPHVRLLEFAECGHYPFVECPLDFAQGVRQFVDDLGTESGHS
jgi:pimeloyl-ACP methyl ester carboxylesterase